jgi:hypothetical protein
MLRRQVAALVGNPVDILQLLLEPLEFIGVVQPHAGADDLQEPVPCPTFVERP